jgi:hypothetical protein
MATNFEIFWKSRPHLTENEAKAMFKVFNTKRRRKIYDFEKETKHKTKHSHSSDESGGCPPLPM